jgi:hypothetical protein
MSRVFSACCTWTVLDVDAEAFAIAQRCVDGEISLAKDAGCDIRAPIRVALTSIQMTDICDRRVVNCPNHKASKYLAAFVADHQVGDGTVHIALRRPIFADRRRLTERPS